MSDLTNRTRSIAARLVSDDEANAIGTLENPIFISSQADIILPSEQYSARLNKVVSAGAVATFTQALTGDTSITDILFGGRAAGQCSFYDCNESATQLVPSGGFNSSGDVSNWTNAGEGSSALLTWTYTTSQFTEGTGSATLTFTQSAAGNTPAIKYTYSTPQDLTIWRYIKADVRVSVAAGGAQSRKVQIILTDVNAATRIYEISGTTTTSPFNVEQWQTIIGEIENPTSQTGTFDIYNVSSITLKLLDGGNKAGTIYWDNVRFTVQRNLLERIYTESNRTFGLSFSSPEVITAGRDICIEIKNNSASSAEFTASAKGYSV